ncbi:MAG TPA: ABC transporter ATP-binding protein [Gammaproteobacteria bacterium]|nr:ABC transporter ATP-binding protein [Gammaproteobacteria bacterium]|tara:strand:+ start:1337 stop:2254 length:918 start_codon:yes stop_codon:yes gene_type:complete
MIEVRNLIFEYPGHRAIDDVSFSIETDSVTALVGPNGAGKTTLMRCLCGLERPLSGDIFVAGIDVIKDPRRSHKTIGYLADTFGLYDELQVRQCLRYAAEANGVKNQIDISVTQTAERLNLTDRLTQRVGGLSRGLRQRVAIGQAIIHEPRVLILDEPASGLDPEARHDLAELIKILKVSGMTSLVSSHILAELGAYATEMLMLRDGQIIEQRLLGKQTESRRHISIELLTANPAIAEMLSTRPEVHSVNTDGARIICEVSGGNHTQQRLLATLVAADAAVVNFSTVEQDLQRSYLDSIRQRQTK